MVKFQELFIDHFTRKLLKQYIMSDHPIGVALLKYACPICGKENKDASAIALGTIFNSRKNAARVEAMNNKIAGFSEQPCKECQSWIDKGAFFIIGVDPEKTEDMSNPYRTGHLVGIKKESDFCKSLPEEYKKKDALFMDYREMEKLGMINQ